MEIIFLGTGAGVPSRSRNATSIALSWLPDANRFWLFDCGEATQHQLWDAGLTLHRLERIYITHLHGDHIFGLPGVLGSRSAYGVEMPLSLFGPKGLKRWVETSLAISETHLRYLLKVHEIESTHANEHIPPPSPDARLIDVETVRGITVKAAWLDHAIPSLGYRIEEPSLPGSLDVEKAQRLGVPAGPLLGRLKKGETVELPTGVIIHAKDVVGPQKRGRVAAILGDTRHSSTSVRLAHDADVLVHESTFTEDYRENAEAFGHSTAKQAADIARAARASKLLLTHISARFAPEDSVRLVDEAKAVFTETEIAHDGYRYRLPRPN